MSIRIQNTERSDRTDMINWYTTTSNGYKSNEQLGDVRCKPGSHLFDEVASIPLSLGQLECTYKRANPSKEEAK